MGLEKAQIIVEHTKEKIPVLFNPEEYSLSKENNFASQAVPGLSSPLLQFVNGNLRTLEMELFLDTYEPLDKRRDVRSETNKIVGLQDITSELHAPPVLQVVWASLSFRCVLARVTQKFIKFLNDGTPVRARLNVTFSEFIDAGHEAKQVNRQTADYSKMHEVTERETLSAIAAHYYKNPQQWRPIAIRNAMVNPRALTIGQKLLIPSLPFTDPETGEVMT